MYGVGFERSRRSVESSWQLPRGAFSGPQLPVSFLSSRPPSGVTASSQDQSHVTGPVRVPFPCSIAKPS